MYQTDLALIQFYYLIYHSYSDAPSRPKNIHDSCLFPFLKILGSIQQLRIAFGCRVFLVFLRLVSPSSSFIMLTFWSPSQLYYKMVVTLDVFSFNCLLAFTFV